VDGQGAGDQPGGVRLERSGKTINFPGLHRFVVAAFNRRSRAPANECSIA
jgi:hypothetical protein